MTIRRYPLLDPLLLTAEAGEPLVRCGGQSDLSEAAYDWAFDESFRQLGTWTCAYPIALNGGEPYGLWL